MGKAGRRNGDGKEIELKLKYYLPCYDNIKEQGKARITLLSGNHNPEGSAFIFCVDQDTYGEFFGM